MPEKPRTLSDLFPRAAEGLTGKGREIFAEASEVRLRVDREARIAEVRCRLPRLFRKRDLYALEENLRECYDLKQVRILPRYDSGLFSMEYLSEVLAEAGRIGIVCHGFFDRYETEGDGENIVISIPFSRGGLTLLSLAETARVIEGIIRSEFDKAVKVELRQSEDAEQAHAEYMAKQLEKLNASSAAIEEEYERSRSLPER